MPEKTVSSLVSDGKTLTTTVAGGETARIGIDPKTGRWVWIKKEKGDGDNAVNRNGRSFSKMATRGDMVEILNSETDAYFGPLLWLLLQFLSLKE